MAPPRTTPRYLRFAQALAMSGATAGLAAGCYASHTVERSVDGGARPDTPIVADAGRDAGRDTGTDAPSGCVDCSCCSCGWDTPPPGTPLCDSIDMYWCCAAIGPCAPPELPAWA